MSVREWELYRLSCIEQMADSPYKTALIEGIKSKLRVLDMEHAELAGPKTATMGRRARHPALPRAA